MVGERDNEGAWVDNEAILKCSCEEIKEAKKSKRVILYKKRSISLWMITRINRNLIQIIIHKIISEIILKTSINDILLYIELLMNSYFFFHFCGAGGGGCGK